MKRRTKEWIEKGRGRLEDGSARSESCRSRLGWSLLSRPAVRGEVSEGFPGGTEHVFRKDARPCSVARPKRRKVPELVPLKAQLASLSAFSVAAHYPGIQANRQAGDDAVRIAQQVRSLVRTKLGLP